MVKKLTLPVSMPRRPDGRGILGQGGSIVDGREVGQIVPIFTGGFSPEQFLINVGITTDCEMVQFDDHQRFSAFLSRIIANPDDVGVAGFVVNPTDGNLQGQPLTSPVDLLRALGRPAGRK